MPGFSRFERPTNLLTLVVCAALVGLVSWLTGYEYVVRLAKFPSAGFFTWKMESGLFAVSSAIFVVLKLRGVFKRPRRNDW